MEILALALLIYPIHPKGQSDGFLWARRRGDPLQGVPDTPCNGTRPPTPSGAVFRIALRRRIRGGMRMKQYESRPEDKKRRSLRRFGLRVFAYGLERGGDLAAVGQQGAAAALPEQREGPRERGAKFRSVEGVQIVVWVVQPQQRSGVAQKNTMFCRNFRVRQKFSGGKPDLGAAAVSAQLRDVFQTAYNLAGGQTDPSAVRRSDPAGPCCTKGSGCGTF